MRKMRKRWKLAACWTLITSLSAQMVIPGFAGVTAVNPVNVAYKDGLCEHHPEHDDECGYGHEHDEDCYTEVLKCLHEHEEECYIDGDFDEEATPSDADEREPENCPHICDEESGCITWTLDCPYGQDEDDMGTCGYICDICEEELATDSNGSQVIISVEYVQELIDALPDAEDITEENADEVIDQLEAIDDAKLLLTDEERELLDFTKYDAAAAALGSVYEVATLANAVKVGDFEVTTDGVLGTDYTYDSGVLTILTSKPLTIKNEDPETYTTDRIVVRKDVSANVTLAGVNIDTETGSPFEIEKDSTGSVVIILANDTKNKFYGYMRFAGVQKEGTNGSLTIQCEQSDEEHGHVCTDECGELWGESASGAGIGSNENSGSSESVSNIRITGGVIVAGGTLGAGIGSGYAESGCSGNVSNIKITGGVVKVGSSEGAGIGSGNSWSNASGNVSNIRITGGVVEAGSSLGAGIGSGYASGVSGSVSNISITGGCVRADSTAGVGSPIGCTPDNGNGENVYLLTVANPNSESVYIDGESYEPVNHLMAVETFTNLYVYLTGESHTVQIGNTKTQYEFNSETGEFESVSVMTYNFEVTGGTEGTDYTYENGVLTILTSTPLTIKNEDPDTTTTDRIVVRKDVSANVTLAGVNIDVSVIEGCAFMIEDDSTGNVTVTLEEETENILCSYKQRYADLQKNGVGDNIGILTINGMGTLIVGDRLGRTARATNGKCGAGIGGGQGESTSNIEITSGTVIASFYGSRTGIGGGSGGSASNIKITGGTVTAIGGESGTGIGGGFQGNSSEITITGGSVHASSIGCTPDNGSGENVYLLTVANQNSESVYIDGEEYLPVNHLAADENDTNLYVYLTGTTHTVKIGDTETQYEFNSETGEFESVSVMTYNFEITGGKEGTDYTYENGVLTILTSTPLKIKNKNPETSTTDRIVVKKDISANVTLAGVNIDVSESYSVSAFEIEKDSSSSVVITLADNANNLFKSGMHSAGLQKEGTNGSLTIQCQNSDEENGHVCTDECGELQISAGLNGTGIGSGYVTGENTSEAVSNITISGGTIEISTGVNGTGIGSGVSQRGCTGTVSDITITGGVVMVSADATGIGSGTVGNNYNSTGAVSDIRITGGVVTVSTNETGIGSGYSEDDTPGRVSGISITGGSVLTTSIGCTPDNGSGENVYLLTLANPNSESVYIDGAEYLPVNHLAADANDTNLYVYLTGTTHTVKIGDTETHYHFDEEDHTFVEAVFDSTYTSDKDGHWYACVNAVCEIKGKYETHDFDENGMCRKCTYDGTAPTGEISIGTDKWNQFLSELTFGVFFKDSQTVNITASDNSDKAVMIGYLLSDKEYTEEALQTAQFTAYNGPFAISPDNQYIIYAKLTDGTGNTAYINTNGIVLDQTAPVISGIENGKIYCESQTVTINETNLASVTVNGSSVELDKNSQFLLSPAEVVQNIIVKDKAGNQTEIRVTVNDGHTPKADDGDCTTAVLCQYCEKVAINAKTHDFSGKWNVDASGHWHVCENAGCEVTDTKIPHSGTDDSDCTTEVKCECGYVITEANTNHNWGEWISDGNGKHFRKCLTEDCTVQSPLSDCDDGDKDHLCDLCKASLSDHIGGTATCIGKAVCDYCGKEYGDIDPSNHSQIQHIEALKATVSKEGHIEYWYCAGCGTYFADEALTQEIHQEDTVIPKKENPHSDEDGYSENSGILNNVNRIFTDVAETDAYYNDILFVYNNGLMSGTGAGGAGTFAPSGSVTGLQLAEILYQMEGRPAITEAEKAAAQSQTSGYGPGMTASYDAVIWAKKAGIHVEANQQMTREQLVFALYRYAQYKGYDVSVGENTNILSYQDFAQVSEWAVPAVQWAVGSGILKDNGNGYLNPKAIVTRAQLAGVLHDFIVKYDLTSVVSENGITIWVKKKEEIVL